jgi:nucleoside-diphosphate-sugar epimerase
MIESHPEFEPMILITGGGGYVGSVLVPELLALGESVRVVDTYWFQYQLAPHPKLETITGDIRSFDSAWLDGVHAVIHLAGLSNDPTADFAPMLNAEVNVLATRGLAELVARKAESENRDMRFLFASTCSVYYTTSQTAEVDAQPRREDSPAAPTANYSKTKRLAELELLRLAKECPVFCPVLLRKGTLYGAAPRMRFDLAVNTFTLHAWHKRQLTVHGSGEAWRPLLHVRDAVDAYVYCLAAPVEKIRGQVWNVLRKNYRTLELAHWVAEILDQHRGVSVQVKRDRTVESAGRSYYVLGEKIERELGFRAERGTTKAVLEIWDGLEAGTYGAHPEENPAFFNIRWFKERCAFQTTGLDAVPTL